MKCPNKQFILYSRVSTSMQGASGLGLDAQKDAMDAYIKNVGGEVIGEYVDIQSGKNDENRPQLQEALNLARKSNSTILVSKLCRLSRDLEFTARLMKDSKISFRVCSMPDADEFTISIWSCMVTQERREISRRTKDALAAAKKRGIRLGVAGKENIKKCNLERIRQADRYANELNILIKPLRDSGQSLRMIADGLNASGITTSRGCKFTHKQVGNILQRVA